MDIIVGTAGHIDHGKTALVKALTGVDTDRLPEEKKRGITIDLGFAELESDGVRFGFVDVPGHERFVKNMLAGASGIDLVMLVIAADEGVMPQTREHFDICRLLDVRSGIVVLTKRDLVDDEMLELVTIEASELVSGSFLADAPVVTVSSRTNVGVDELKRELISVAKENHPISRNGCHLAPSVRMGASEGRVPILPIDRVFTIKGFGTVVTGTLASGEIKEGDELDLLPVGKTMRVRGLQTHGKTVKLTQAGQRTAVNLAGIDRDEIERGMLLAEKGVLRPTQAFDAKIEVLGDVKRPLKTRQRVRVHIGATEVLARLSVLNPNGEIELGESDLAQLRLESPVTAIFGDRFVIRSYSPQTTIAGGIVLDPFAERHRRKEFDETRGFLEKLETAGDDGATLLEHFVERAGEKGITENDLWAVTGWTANTMKAAIRLNVDQGNILLIENLLIVRRAFDTLRSHVLAAIDSFHKKNALARGIGRERLRERVSATTPDSIFNFGLVSLETDKAVVLQNDVVRAAGFSSAWSQEEESARSRLIAIYRTAGLEVPKLDEALTDAGKGTNLSPAQVRCILHLLTGSRELAKVTDEFYFSRETIDALAIKLRAFADASPDRLIDVGKFKEIAGVSRKYAIPLLEYFDREKVTVRSGDKRLILK